MGRTEARAAKATARGAGSAAAVVCHARVMAPDATVVARLRAAYPTVLAVYRFGSTARGEATAASDLDSAFLPAEPVERGPVLALALELGAVVGRDVDLVDLAAAPTALEAQVVAQGERLYSRDRAEVDRYEDYVYSSYARLNGARAGILEDIVARGTVLGP